MPKKSRVGIVLISIFIITVMSGCSMPSEQENTSSVEEVNKIDAGVQETDTAIIPVDGVDTATDFDDSYDYYEYYLTKEELISDIEQGYIFKVDTAFTSEFDAEGTKYEAPYVLQDNWFFYVHEDNTVNLDIAFSNLLIKPNNNIFPESERIIVEVISPDEQSVYRFEKSGDEITEDTSVQEQISVTPGEWKLQISYAYVCNETPSHLKIAVAYETPSEEDINWLKEERLKI